MRYLSQGFACMIDAKHSPPPPLPYAMCVKHVMSAQILDLSQVGAGTVLRLERDAWSMVKRQRQAPNEYASPSACRTQPPPSRHTTTAKKTVHTAVQREKVSKTITGDLPPVIYPPSSSRGSSAKEVLSNAKKTTKLHSKAHPPRLGHRLQAYDLYDLDRDL